MDDQANQSPDAPVTAEAAEAAEAVTTVAMVREEPQFAGGPVTADVHPDEVENFMKENWTIAGDQNDQEHDGKGPVMIIGDDRLDGKSAEELRSFATEHGLKVTHLPNVKPETLLKQIREALAAKAAANG